MNRDAAGLVAGDDRALDRRGPAPARQQRRMHVQPQRLLEEARRNVEAVGADDHAVDLLGQSGLLRLVDGYAELRRDELRRRRGQPAAAPTVRVRTGEKERDLVRELAASRAGEDPRKSLL